MGLPILGPSLIDEAYHFSGCRFNVSHSFFDTYFTKVNC
jgi:hypothetical protein